MKRDRTCIDDCDHNIRCGYGDADNEYGEWEKKMPSDWNTGNSFDSFKDYRNALIEWGHKHPFCKEYENSNSVYVKIKAHYGMSVIEGFDDYSRQLELYASISHLNITPQLIDHCILYNKNNIFIYTIITEKFGYSLTHIYFKYYHISLPGLQSHDILKNDKSLDIYFPKIAIEHTHEGINNEKLCLPDNVRAQLRPLVKSLLDCGWIHDDLHCGNFVQNEEGIVKIIDFDLVRRVNTNK